jgi:hypothetical protein
MSYKKNTAMMKSYLEQQDTNRSEKLEEDDDEDCEEEEDDNDEQQTPTDEELEDFKEKVNTWLDLDTVLTKLKQALKERKLKYNVLTHSIGEFMSKYNIEDLNTKQGKVRCKSVDVKSSLTQKMIKERIVNNIRSAPSQDPEALIDSVFKREPNSSRKIVLKRMKGSLNI